MKVRVKAIGTMMDYLGEETIDIHLTDGATLQNLFEYFDTHLSSLIPAFLWNKRKRQFRGPVVVTIDQTVVRNLKTPLKNGQEIQLVKAIVGG